MDNVTGFLAAMVSRFNPADPVNLTLFFTWLVIFVFTFTGVWRARWRWVRLTCYLVNQAVSFVMLQAGLLTIAILYGRWREAAAVAIVTFAAACWLFRERRKSAHVHPGPAVESRRMTQPSSARIP